MSYKFALIGQPVKHSRSPAIHQAFAQQFDLDISYELIETDAEQVEETIKNFFANGGHGMNVTLPHKNAAMSACDQLHGDGEIAQAINTLVSQDAVLSGHNTDGAGLVRDLKKLKAKLKGARIAVIGAGGAARGILKPLLDEQPAELVWSNRSPWKPQEQEGDFKTYGPIRACTNLALKGDRFDLVINATAAGHSGAVPALPNHLFAEGGMAYDLSYGDVALSFLAWAKQQGAQDCHDGYGMLVEQAALAFELWTGKKPDTTNINQ